MAMEQLQRGDSSAPALILIHDGGGTTLAYHSFESLGRDGFAIENPLLHTGRPWPGSIAGIARAYSSLVCSQLAGRSIVLGGWSFWGLVALEMATLLSRTSDLRIVGILLLDSLCPRGWKAGNDRLRAQDIPFANHVPASSRLVVRIMMKLSVSMAEEWQVPHWRSCKADRWGRQACRTPECFAMAPMPVPVNSSTMNSEGPMVVLIRCAARVDGCGSAERVDAMHDCGTLGWDHVRPGLVTNVLHLPSSHFDLFSKHHRHETGVRTIEALAKMEARVGGD